MVTFSMLLFWIPVCIGVISFFYFTKRSRKAIILVLSFLPSAFFIIKIIKHTFYQSLSALNFYVVGLFCDIFIRIINFSAFITIN
ncbi:hypothetical protein [Enterococcus faecium]|uniref:hypothetical protein n=2 Tax=Enterococcus faecium TaxID=1352 RepID=UPI000A355EC7|nr:hypothetical protein [Enterococcus faecium]EGP5304431.1 hypothetical protein [Enterococcus faecium]EGP5325882.1 hypothetical protein [Enterococcus faecium]EGP5433092.1 hypothetical protein [Enterococcus faecium]EGP5666505.1 hypothetical protein [Enterococcus faecium]MDK4346647.1 hypothetical protein [Enterococcus faecium]